MMTAVCIYLMIGIGLSFRRTPDIALDASRDGDKVRAAAWFVVTWPMWVGRV